MELTSGTVAHYIGGQLHVRNRGECYLYCGEIKTATVESTESGKLLKITLAWNAEGEGYPHPIRRWVNNTNLAYEARLRRQLVTDLQDGCISLHSPDTGEVAVLFPPNDRQLDPSEVEGLSVR